MLFGHVRWYRQSTLADCLTDCERSAMQRLKVQIKADPGSVYQPQCDCRA